MLQCAPISTVPVLKPAPMLLQLIGTGGKLYHFRCGHISLHHIATIDDMYQNDILGYRGYIISLLYNMTPFIKLIITRKITKMVKMLQLAPLSPTSFILFSSSIKLKHVGIGLHISTPPPPGI